MRRCSHFFSGLAEEKYFLAFILIVTILFLFFYRTTFQLGMVAGPNTFIPNPDSKTEFEQLWSMWNYHGLGNPSPKSGFAHSTSSAILLLIFSNNAILVEKVFLLFPMPLMAITMYIFLRYMLRSQYWKFVIALIYSINPITINQFNTQTIWVHIVGAIFPLVLLYTFKFVRSQNIRDLLLLSSLVAIGTAFRVQAFIWYMLFIAAIAIANVIERKDLKYGLKLVLRLALLTGIVFTVLTPIILIPITSLIQGHTHTALRGYGLQSIGSMIKSFYMTFAQSNDLYAFIFASFILAFFTLLVYNKARQRYAFCLLGVIGLLMTLFLLLRGKDWVPGSVISLLVFYTADYPGSLMVLISWSFILLLVFLIEEAYDRGILSFKRPHNLNLRTAGKFVTGGILTTMLILPIFVYNLYDTKNSDFYLGVDFSNAEIPPIFLDLNSWLQAQTTNGAMFRTLWLPTAPQAIPNYFGILYVYGSNSLLIDSVIDSSVVRPLTLLVNNETEYFGTLLSLANVKYIIVDLTAPNVYSNYATGPARISGLCPIGSPESYVALLNRQKDLRVVVDDADAIIYENMAFIPHTAVYEKMFIVERNEFGIPPSVIMKDVYNLTTSSVLFVDKDTIPNDSLNQYLAISSGTVSFYVQPGLNPDMTAYSDEASVNHYEVSQKGPTSFFINTSGKSSLYITFSESFDPDWAAYLGTQLEHLPLPPYNTNLFYLNENGYVKAIEISYELQSIYEFTLIVAVVAWVIVSLIIYLSKGVHIYLTMKK